MAIVSMTTSNAASMPRDASFLLSPNRLNVAISRAWCLAVIVAYGGLLDLDARSVEEMRLANLLCRARRGEPRCGTARRTCAVRRLELTAESDVVVVSLDGSRTERLPKIRWTQIDHDAAKRLVSAGMARSRRPLLEGSRAGDGRAVLARRRGSTSTSSEDSTCSTTSTRRRCAATFSKH